MKSINQINPPESWTDNPDTAYFPQMNAERMAFAASLSQEDTIYVSGGYNIDNEVLNSIESLDISGVNSASDLTSLTWKQLAPMKQARCCHKSLIVNNMLYILAGSNYFDGANWTIEYYNAEKYDVISQTITNDEISLVGPPGRYPISFLTKSRNETSPNMYIMGGNNAPELVQVNYQETYFGYDIYNGLNLTANPIFYSSFASFEWFVDL